MSEAPENKAVRELTRLILNEGVADVNTPGIEILRQVPAPLVVLGQLAESNYVDVRMWVVFTIADGAVTGGEEILERLGRDRDPDVRTEAISALVQVNPDGARRLVPSLIKRLSSPDYYEPITAMWSLAALRAVEGAPAIRDVADRWDANDWHHKVATIILDLLEGRTERILERIAAHDHVGMKWLARAAAIVSSPAAIETLRSAEQNRGLDEECLGYVRRALEGSQAVKSSAP